MGGEEERVNWVRPLICNGCVDIWPGKETMGAQSFIAVTAKHA